MSSTLHQPHDFLFRKSMSDLRVAKDFFLEHLPSTLQKQIDWSQLTLQNVSFLDEHFKRSAADMLYQVTLKNGKLAYLYLLCEHTSEPDPLLAFRLVKYMVRIIQQHTEQHPQTPFPAVYPMALYTGKKPYTYTLDWYTLFGEQEDLMRQVFNNPFQLINVSQIEDTELRQYLWAGAFEFMFKYRLRTHLTPQLETELMTIGEQLRQEGKQQGIQQGEYIFLHSLLQRKFHHVPQHYLDRMRRADADTLLKWGHSVLDAHDLRDIFVEDK